MAAGIEHREHLIQYNMPLINDFIEKQKDTIAEDSVFMILDLHDHNARNFAKASFVLNEKLTEEQAEARVKETIASVLAGRPLDTPTMFMITPWKDAEALLCLVAATAPASMAEVKRRMVKGDYAVVAVSESGNGYAIANPNPVIPF